jgi:ADP-heptose:LPS heptosyltransferase
LFVTVFKPLERSLRRAFLAATRRPFRGDFVATPRNALPLGDPPRLLLLRHDRIGDVIVSIPVLRALRARLPGAEIHILLSRTNHGLEPALLPYVNRTWRYDKSLSSAIRILRSLRREHYDAVIDLSDNASASAELIARWAGARARVGINHSGSGVYTHAVPLLDRARIHIVERMAQLLLPFGIDPAAIPLDLEYPLSDEDRARARTSLARDGMSRRRPWRLVVNVSGGSPARYWGARNFIEFLNWFGTTDARFEIWIGGAPSYAKDIAAIAAATGAAIVPPVRGFHDYAAVIREFDLLLTPDTSVLHLGAAWKIPTIALFHQPPGAPLPWFPYRSPYRAVLHADGVERIAVAAVQEATRSLLEERFPRG